MGLRRTGKTSLMKELKNRLRRERNIIFVEVDCEGCTASPDVFFKRYVEAVIDAYLSQTGLFERVGSKLSSAARSGIAAITEFFSRIREVGIKTAGEAISAYIKIEGGQKVDLRSEIARAIDLPEKIGSEKKKYFIVFLDEFQYCQDLERFEETRDFLRVLRAHFQRQKRVVYVIAGSSVSMMEKITRKPKSPFFMQFIERTVGDLPSNSAKEMVKTLAGKSGFSMDNKAIEKMIELVGLNPFYLQALGFESCRLAKEKGKRNISSVLIEDAYNFLVLNPHGALYSYLKYVLDLSLKEARGGGILKELLKIIATKDLHTLSQIAKEMKRSYPHTHEYLKRLIEVDLIEKKEHEYHIRDPLLRKWFKNIER